MDILVVLLLAERAPSEGWRGSGQVPFLLAEEVMEPDDLLCSRNARSRTPLVGRAQLEINQPPSLRDNERAWRDHF
jgi:hypothetical protein